MVVEDEAVAQRGAAPLEVVVDYRASHLEHGSGGPSRGVAAGVALEELRAGAAAIVGVGDNVRGDTTLDADFDDLEGLNLEGEPVLTSPCPAEVQERQPVAGGGEYGARQSCPRPGDQLAV